ncbi:putative histone acetyltransferase chromatin regulator PHD family [Helianthus annuus]|nr:putative histone acetyltransferase chromatin regulator PHD family [Helianthus annuus]
MEQSGSSTGNGMGTGMNTNMDMTGMGTGTGMNTDMNTDTNNVSIDGTGAQSAHTVDFDLNKTPPPSPPPEQPPPAAGNDDGATADHRCASCSQTQGEMVECSLCIKLFHVDCLQQEATDSQNNFNCANCSTKCRRAKRLRRSSSAASGGDSLGLMDMNASPPREVDDDVMEVCVNQELVEINGGFKMQDTFGNLLAQYTLTSPNTRTNMQNTQLNLDIETQNAHLAYLQALKDYISKKRGVLGDGWRVEFKSSESTSKTSPVYCAPDGSKFDSMRKVARYLGLLSESFLFETKGNDSSSGLLQNGSRRTISIGNSSRSMSGICNGGNAFEVDPVQNGNRGSALLLDGFPIQLEDFFITSIGKIDPQPSFHNTSQIWPVGYKSMWHDKLTGSIFVCTVSKNDDCAPTFKVTRYPCAKQSIPNASTVIYKPKCGPSDLVPPTSLTTESQHMTSNNSVDLIGEISVEGRSPSSAWQLVIETLLFACRQSFRDLNFLSFCCNHSVESLSQHSYGSYGIDSLDKFGCLAGETNSIPRLILTVDQFDFSCTVLRRWLQPDRFGLDAEFVQELIEQLPEASSCSGYKSLDARCQNSIAHTVGSGSFTVLRKYRSLPAVSDSIRENDNRPGPPGNKIASDLPPSLIGNALQVYEFFLRFHNVLGQEAPLSRQKLEYELLNPWIHGLNYTNTLNTKSHDENFVDATKRSEGYDCQSLLSDFQMAMVKMLVEDMLSKIVINDPSNVIESKSRKARKKNMEVKVNVHGQKSKIGIFPVNEFTWPELARRYILVLLSMDDGFEDLEITGRVFNDIFLCLSGNGGPLCGYLTGMAAIEADAVVLAEASKKVFSSVKSRIVDFIIDKKDLNINNSAIDKKRNDNKCPEWIKLLEPIRKQPTNVGAKIRNRVKRSLEKGPPEWATEMLLKSISKDVYKGNAAGPTKKIVVEVLEKVRKENPLTRKKTKESRVIRTVSDVIMKRCRMVLRDVAAQDGNKFFFSLMAESFLKTNESDDDGNLELISRPLDFRTIDLRLDAGSYNGSHESFIEDVREVMQNLRIKYTNKFKYLELIEKISKKLEDRYEQEVLTLVNKTVQYVNDSPTSSSAELKTELNMMIAETIATTISVAPWEVGICKICGKDENDHILLLCDRCDAEYHTYCLNPPLQRIPKSSWYCPPCISFITSQSQTMSREDDFDSLVLSQPSEKRSQREFIRNGLEALADLADRMESTEYWELGVKERVFLLQFLSDEALSSTAIREYISAYESDIERNYLGRDWAGRLYWTLGGPERLFVSGPHCDGEVCVPSDKEFDSWFCYESDTEIEALIEWLRDDDAREKKLKEAILKWQKGALNDPDSRVHLQDNCLRSSVYSTKARAELENKFGSFDENIRRCDCLELVGCNLHHCFSCHSSFFDDEVHQCTSFDNQLTLTNELVNSSGNPSFFVPEDHLHDNNAAFLVKQEVKSNESPSEVDQSNLEGITGKNPSFLSGSVTGRVSEIIRCLKMILFDIETTLPREAFRPSRVDPDKLRGWRAFLKSAQSIHEMVQAVIIFEDMIKTEHLKKEWWHWSSPSAAAKISTISSLALHIYALDAAISYEKPPPPPPPPPQPQPPLALTEPVAAGDSASTEQTPKKSNLKNNLKSCTSTSKPNDLEHPFKVSKSEEKPKNKKLKVSHGVVVYGNDERLEVVRQVNPNPEP